MGNRSGKASSSSASIGGGQDPLPPLPSESSFSFGGEDTLASTTSSSASSATPMSAMDQSKRKLRIWHYVLGTIHLLAAVLLTLLVAGVSTPVPLDVRKHELVSDSSHADGYRWATTSIGSLQGSALVAIFFGVTAGAHFFYATNALGSGMYERHVFEEQVNPMRWVEYAFSASAMILLIAAISGVKDLDTILLIGLGTAVIMLQGLIVEYQLRQKKSAGGKVPVTLAATLGGWALLTLIFVVILTNFGRRLSELKALGIELPSWLQYVSIPMVIWFSSFGVVQLVQIFKGGDFVKYEYAYTLLSAASKLFLGIWVTVGILQQRNNDVITGSDPAPISTTTATQTGTASTTSTSTST